jgi:glycogen debranching enzyme
MNATIDGRPAIPRSGYLVEFNALWYNALKFSERVAFEMDKNELAELLEERAHLAGHSFTQIFLNSAGYLYDYVDGYYKDPNVRPNMIFAVSLPYSPLTRSQKKTIIDFITKELFSACGIRSLSPKSGDFHSHYAGTVNEKKFAYFNGPAFPWLLGAYIEAYLKIFGMSGLSLADRIMVEMEDEIQNDCIGTISELYDSHPPFVAHGGYSFAMSVAELLRAMKMIEHESAKAYKCEEKMI